MSHTTTISGIKIKDAAAIKAAVLDLQNQGVKCELKENAVPRMYFAEQGTALGKLDYVLHLPNARFDVGFQKQADGSYAPVFDEHANIVGSQIGAQAPLPQAADKTARAQHQIGRFMQNYTKHAIINQARKEGRSIRNMTTNAKGEMVVTLAGY